ncbi:ATP synthase F1 subunit gamma [Clostridiaceae bacterium]|jgi:ATP synthase F1 gamma subunit|nr:ATP synthase F1 subunit gamma [Clostridium sp.]NBI72392.1 ATP synthase F1 subunit gamma [Clostridiaceae bacterium]
MAANMKAVKLRMKSIQSTMQITKAMELVASSKLRKAKERADLSRPYFQTLHDTLTDIASGNTDFTSPYTKASDSPKWCYVIIAGDRGLAGGYNSNLFKLLESQAKGKDYSILPIGKKAVDYCKRRKVHILTEEFAEAGDISVSDCFEMAKLLCSAYCKGDFGHIALCYTSFLSMLSQRPDVSSLLPLDDFTEKEDGHDPKHIRSLILYEPDSESVFNAIVPEYLAGLIYGAMCESVASELAARRTAMDAATKNAGEMIEQLSLYYNRARQASITQEITEIVAGAEQP